MVGWGQRAGMVDQGTQIGNVDPTPLHGDDHRQLIHADTRSGATIVRGISQNAGQICSL